MTPPEDANQQVRSEEDSRDEDSHQVDDSDEDGSRPHVQTETVGVAFHDALVVDAVHGEARHAVTGDGGRRREAEGKMVQEKERRR